MFKNALNVAMYAHKDQLGKDGMPYIYHVMRVSGNFQDIRYQVVALLHDVVEDCKNYSFDDFIFLDMDDEMMEALKLLTKPQQCKSYQKYIEAIRDSGNDIAKLVKLMDLRDNINVLRFKEIGDPEYLLIKRYHQAIKTLSNRDIKYWCGRSF